MNWPLDWRELVDESVRRRKDEGHTQKSLAALAGVSVPTVNAFEQGDIKPRLEKVFNILDALGMVILPEAPGSFSAFVRSARQRWEALVAPIPSSHPSRQSLGHVGYAYEIGSEHPDITLGKLRSVLEDLPATSGWSPFWVPTKDSVRPIIRDGLIECWLGDPDANRLFRDPGHSDFWQVNGELMAYLQRGFQEDGPSNLEPGTIFDLTLPVWRTAELFVHIANLAQALRLDSSSSVAFESRYTGLDGRELVQWAAPLRRWSLDRTYRSRTEGIGLTLITDIEALRTNLERSVYNAVKPLYDLFDGYEATYEFVAAEVAEYRKSAERF